MLEANAAAHTLCCCLQLFKSDIQFKGGCAISSCVMTQRAATMC